VTGRNGFEDLYVAGYDVAATAAGAAFASELAYRRALAPDGTVVPGAPPPPSLLGTDAAPERPAIDPAALCPLNGCYPHVRSDPEATRAALAAEAERLAAADRAFSADYLRNPFPEGPGQPLPPYQLFRAVLASAALDAVDGRVPQAYARTCTLLGAMRRLSTDPGSLIDKMVGVAFGTGAATQLLDLRRHHPVASLPDECGDAVAPLRAEETSICRAMRGEFGAMSGVRGGLQDRLDRLSPPMRPLLWAWYDFEMQDGWLASGWAGYCAAEREARALRGLPTPAPSSRTPALGTASCWSAYVSCILANIALPAYDDYAERTLDGNAKLRLLLAAHAVADGTRSPRDAVSAATVEGYPPTFDDTGLVVTIPQLAPGGAPETWELDLSGLAPASRPEPEDAHRP
jgi:hypothetical protein